MSLSKKNLDELNNFIKDKNLTNDIKISSNKNKHKNQKKTPNQPKSEDPNEIFYHLIDNSETLEETSEVNHLLKKSEVDFVNINSRKTNYSRHLTLEDELYDEFNYLLEE